MANRGERAARAAMACVLMAIIPLRAGRGQEGAAALHDGFESDRTAWTVEKTDAEIRIFTHDRSGRVVREGKLAEHFQFEAGPGGEGFYASYALPKVLISEDLRVGLQARSDRPGVQLLARVILPADVDPETNKPSYVMVGGSTLQSGDRWQRLELRDLPKAVEGQARVLRASTKRRVNVEGAYLDRLVVNLYGGPGSTEVYLDELRVEPVEATVAESFAKAVRARDSGEMPPLPASSADAATAGEAPGAKAGPAVAMRRNMLTRRGYSWLPTIIRAPYADPVKLRRAGFDVVAVPGDAEDDAIKAMAETGLMLMPEVDSGRDGLGLAPQALRRLVEGYPARDSVAFWMLGRGLGSSISLEARKRERDRVAEAARALRLMKDAPGLSAGEVSGFFPRYARAPEQLDVIAARPAGWGTTQEVLEMFAYLQQRRDVTALENADALIAAWLDMAPDPAFSRAIWGRDRPPSYGVPRVHPDQLRQSAYIALSAGCRALGFDADADLTRGAGRALLIEAALLNEEIDLIEWLLADTAKSAQMLQTYHPDVVIGPAAAGVGAMMSRQTRKPEMPAHPTIRAAAFGTKDRRGILLLIADYAVFSQYQPPQMALLDLTIDVPGLPDEAIAYEISPGDVRVISSKRTPGGIKIKVPEFGPTALVYLTTDGARAAEIQRAVVGNRAPAVNYLIEQVEILQAQTLEVHRMLLEDGHKIPDFDVAEHLGRVDKALKGAQEARERLDFGEAWRLAARARRGLTHLMRLHWENAQGEIVKLLTDPKAPNGPTTLPGFDKPPVRCFTVSAVPPLTSYATLREAWFWKDWIAKGKLSGNFLPSGNFEDPEGLAAAGWVDESYESEGTRSEFVVQPERVGKQFRRSLKLSGPPEDKERGVDKMPPFLDHPVAAVRTPPIKVYEAELIRIAVQVEMPTPCLPGAGGVFVRDSIGGEPLQFRSTTPVSGWQEVVLYRRAPADGEMTVMLGYGGHQFAKFDNLRIQKVVSKSDDESPVASAPDPNPAPRTTRRR